MNRATFYHWLWDRPPILRYTEMDDADIGDWLPHERVYRLPFHAWHRTADQIEREESAGENRQRVADERAAQERSSEPS